MEEIKATPRTTVNRMRKRGTYDREVIHAILDRSLVCHVGVTIDGAPRVLPTLHARIDDRVYIHGAASNRMLGAAAAGIEICLTATLIGHSLGTRMNMIRFERRLPAPVMGAALAGLLLLALVLFPEGSRAFIYFQF